MLLFGGTLSLGGRIGHGHISVNIQVENTTHSLARVGVWSLQHTQCPESAALLCSLLNLEQGSSYHE